MIAVSEVYENGRIILDKKVQAKRTIKVIVTFLDEEVDEENKCLKISDFSFMKSREKTKRFNGSLSESIIEDRRSEL